jgi:hypothetical protein
MKTVRTTLFFVLVGLGIVSLIHGSLSIVLTNFTEVKYDAGVSMVICVCAGLAVSSLYDRV